MRQVNGSIAEVLRDLSRALRALRVPWYVFGAQALVLHGCPRATADLDVTVLLGALPTQRLADALAKAGFAIRIDDESFVASTRVLPVVHRTTMLPVDIVLGGPGLEQRFANAAEVVALGRLKVPVCTCTHLVLMKILASRPKDLEDAATLLVTQKAAIDMRELRELAKQLASALAEDDVLGHLAEASKRAQLLAKAVGKSPKSRPAVSKPRRFATRGTKSRA